MRVCQGCVEGVWKACQLFSSKASSISVALFLMYTVTKPPDFCGLISYVDMQVCVQIIRAISQVAFIASKNKL